MKSILYSIVVLNNSNICWAQNSFETFFILDLLNEKIPTTAAMTLSKVDVQSTDGKSYFWCNTSLFVTSYDSHFLLEFENGSLLHLVNGT